MMGAEKADPRGIGTCRAETLKNCIAETIADMDCVNCEISKPAGKTMKVVYIGDLCSELDMDILTALSGNGFNQYASGYNYATQERVLCFDVPVLEGRNSSLALTSTLKGKRNEEERTKRRETI